MKARFHRKGFTVRDLMVTTIVLAVLLSLVAVALQFTREASRRSRCVSSLVALNMGMVDYQTRYRSYPSACTADRDPATGFVVDVGLSGGPSTAGWSWMAQSWPHWTGDPNIPKPDLASAGPLDKGVRYGNGPGTPQQLMAWREPIFTCPSFRGSPYVDPARRTAAITNYKAMGATHGESLKMGTPLHAEAMPGYPPGDAAPDPKIHPDGALVPGVHLKESDFAADGISHTIFLCETKEQEVARWTVGMETVVVGLPPEIQYTEYGDQPKYYAPDGGVRQQSAIPAVHPEWRTYVGFDYETASYTDPLGLGARFGPSSDHDGVVFHAFGDCNVRGISSDIDPGLYMFLITRNNHDPTGPFFAD